MAMIFKSKTCTNPDCGEPFNLNACLDGKHFTCPACDKRRKKGENIPNKPAEVKPKKVKAAKKEA